MIIGFCSRYKLKNDVKMKNKNKYLFFRLLNLSREEWPILIKGMIFLFISSAALMVYPQYIKVIIDDSQALFPLLSNTHGDILFH